MSDQVQDRGSVTCADDAVGRQLVHERRQVRVPVLIQLPTGDAEVEPKPGGVGLCTAVPLDRIVALPAGTYPEWED